VPGHGEQVSRDRLLQLLDHGEGDDLDFKADCNLSDRQATVAIAKDVGAFSAAGGHLVIGVGEDGTPAGRLTRDAAALFDEATLRSKLAPQYLPATISLTTAVHDVEGAPVVIVYVAAHPNGFVVMQRDGDYTDAAGRQQKAFFAGHVYIRRGSASRPWNHEEADAALDRAMALRREVWRTELRQDLGALGIGEQAQQIARGPAANFTWQLDNEAFIATLVELLRAHDDIAVTLGFDGMLRDAIAAHARASDDTLRTILDRLVSATAVAITTHRPELLDSAVSVLLRVYNQGFDARGLPRSVPNMISPPELWLEVITGVYALGALAVRKRDWPALRTLTLQRGSGQDFNYYSNWLRHSLTQAARANLLQTQEGERRIELSLLSLAAEYVDRLEPLRPDVPVGDEAIVNSLTQFDLLSILTTIAEAGTLDSGNWYTNFARYDWSRSEPALIDLLSDEEIRRVLFPLDDQHLADAIREVSSMAAGEGIRFSVWRGWDDAAVNRFLADHPVLPADG
jgi:hypothetical protein